MGRHGHDDFAGHHHGDSPQPHSTTPTGGGRRALIVALVLISVFSLVEFLGGIWSGSLALLADAGHMVTDAASLAFSLAAYVIAQRPASERHSYGLARAEVIAAFVNSLALVAVVAWLVIEGVHRVLAPHAVDGRAVIVIAGAGIVVNLIVAWFLSRERDNLNMRAALLHVLGDLLGSVAALVAGIVILTTGYTVVDPLLSMLVGGLILRSTLGVLRESTMVLLDSVPSDVDYTSVGRALAAIDGVLSVHDLHVWALVPGRHAVSAHLLIGSVDRWPRILHDAREHLRGSFGIDHVTLQPEWLAEGPVPAITLKLQRD
jgi:cobalt-zinc-cadmium efflux system protein